MNMAYAKGDYTGSDRFVIGEVGQEKFWTNTALKELDGTLPNARLLKMSDQELRALARHGDDVCIEWYKRTEDRAAAEKQGGYPGEIYIGVTRAFIILDYREKKRAEEAIGRAAELKALA